MAWRRSGSSRITRRSSSRGTRGGGQRRKFTWKSAFFTPSNLPDGSRVEYVLATEAELAALALGRGTITMIYGKIVIWNERASAIDTFAIGAYGICLKEADAPSTGTSFSPVSDADSSIWMHLRAFSVYKEDAAGTPSTASQDVANHVDEFIIRNPRKIKLDEELVCNFEVSSSSTSASVEIMAWFRIGILLP